MGGGIMPSLEDFTNNIFAQLSLDYIVVLLAV